MPHDNAELNICGSNPIMLYLRIKFNFGLFMES